MSQDTPADHVSKKRVVYQIPNMNKVMVHSELEYRLTVAGPLTMDLYYPPDAKNGARLPAVVFIAGYPDPGFQKLLGCRLKDMGAYTSWGRLMATSGMVAVTYTNRDPVLDAQSLLQYIRQNANRLGIDEHRIGLWACSGNVPLALSILMKQEINKYVKCAVLCYGFMLDLDGSDIVVKAAKLWGFVNSCAGKSVEDLPQGVPLLIVRAGLDQTPHLNETIDQFLPKALSKNLPITLANHAAAPHGFDLLDESDLTRGVIRGILAFMRFHLLGRF